MTGQMLNEFVEQGYLDRSVTETFDPYYEPAWWAEEENFSSESETFFEQGSPALSFSEKGGW